MSTALAISHASHDWNGDHDEARCRTCGMDRHAYLEVHQWACLVPGTAAGEGGWRFTLRTGLDPLIGHIESDWPNPVDPPSRSYLTDRTDRYNGPMPAPETDHAGP